MTAVEGTKETAVTARSRRTGRLAEIAREIGHRPIMLVGLVVWVTFIAMAIGGQHLAPYGINVQDISHRLQGPSEAHRLGTDELGRDLLSRLMVGTRYALGVAIPAVAIALVVGVVVGMTAGYFGNVADRVVVTLLDSLQAFPAVILALTLLALVGHSLRNVTLVIAVAFIPSYARVTRALVMAAKNNQWVDAERSLGAHPLRIVVMHIFPNIAASLFVLMAMDIPSAITISAGLDFLGLGLQPPTPSWGGILSSGFFYVQQSPWPVIWASAFLMIATLGFTLLAEGLRDVVDPRLTR
jgi:ABC-type dipeptide/oligopeptide/nickel transport systems, permease components